MNVDLYLRRHRAGISIPAIAVATACCVSGSPDCKILFVGAEDGMENKLGPA